MEKTRYLTEKYCALQSLYWMLAAVGLAFMTPLLEDKGFSSMEIGWLNAVKYLSVIVFQTKIGSFMDKKANQISLKSMMEGLSLISMITAAFLYFCGHNFWEAAVLLILTGATVNCLSSLVDALAIRYMKQNRKLHYTCSRACGSASWAISCVVIGGFADRFGLQNILWLQIAATALFFGQCIGMDSEIEKKKTKNGPIQNTKEKSHSAVYILRHYPKYTWCLIAFVFIFMGYNMNATFLIDLIKTLGGTTRHLGMAEFVLAAAEIPVAIFFPQIRRWFKMDTLLFICAVFCTMRALATALAPTLPVLIAAQGLELFGLAIFYPAGVFFVMENLPPKDSGKGVALINVATAGVGDALASLFTGKIRLTYGIHTLMIVSAVVSAIGIGGMWIMRYQKKDCH